MPTPDETPVPDRTQPDELPAAYRGGPAVVALRTLAKLDEAISTAAGSVVGAVGGMLEQVLAEIRAGRPVCAPCAIARARWNRVNADKVEVAHAGYARAMAETTGEGQPLNLMDFLPAEIRPDPNDPVGVNSHMPGVFPAVAQVSGTDVCRYHLAELEEEQAAQPGEQAAQPQPGQPSKRPIILTGLSVHAAARLARSNIAGMPGTPGY